MAAKAMALKTTTKTLKQKQREKEGEAAPSVVTPEGVRWSGQRSALADYDKIMVGLAQKQYPPAEIADILHDQHGLLSHVASCSTVEQHLQNLKKNKLYDFPPTNDPKTLKATENPPKSCFSLLCFLLSLLFSSNI